MSSTNPQIINLEAPILDGGIRSANFANGRLLSGEDLTLEKEAGQLGRMRLGQAVGDGIAFGLEVGKGSGNTVSNPVVSVNPGLAVNRLGQTLYLTVPAQVSLLTSGATGASASPDLFVACRPPQAGGYVAGAGVYLLTIGPTQVGVGKAPVSGLGNNTAGCATRYLVDGVKFNLIQVNLPLEAFGNEGHLRNRVAYMCYGAYDPRLIVFPANPLGLPTGAYGLVDDLRATCLSDDQVPLALLYWTATGGLKFIDLWSVRRRLTQPPASPHWPLLLGDRRLSETEAMLQQFQDQVADMAQAEPNLAGMVGTSRFDFLPPVGLMPLVAPAGLLQSAAASSPAGFNPQSFFGNQASHDVALIDGDSLRSLWHEARYHEPLPLGTQDKIQLYLIYENIQAVEARLTNQLVLVFAGGALPYRGVARFGYAKWELSRFAPGVI